MGNEVEIYVYKAITSEDLVSVDLGGKKMVKGKTKGKKR